jgi:DNA repair protein RecN (Recombination protein N)
LAKLSQHRQLLCISHLPQVAALGEHHYSVSKYIEDNEVFGAINHLEYDQRVIEIGRMLGGTEAARQHAESLLKR